MMMEKREQLIAESIDNLITEIKGKAADENLREQIQSYSRRVFSGGPGRPINDSPNELI